jgi:outer membrane lipoprotein-sorting protein
MMRFLLGIILSFSLVAAGFAQQPLSDASTREDILDALNTRGQGLKDFTADVSLAETDALSGETSTLVGKVWYQGKGEGDARMRVLFDKKLFGDKPQAGAKVEYVLDKEWLTDRDHKRKVEIKRQVLKPGEKINLLKLGEGPFPLPIGQPKEEVLKMFDVKKIGAQKGDPEGTVHVELAPKDKTQFARKFKKIDVWVENKTNFPRRIATVDKSEAETRTTDLTNIQVNVGVKDDAFALQKLPEGWTQKSEQMDQ